MNVFYSGIFEAQSLKEPDPLLFKAKLQNLKAKQVYKITAYATKKLQKQDIVATTD